jgi:3-oxoacyl-[acyl-carrier-protein] synthase-3
MKIQDPIGIVSIGAYAPPRILSNKDLESMLETSDEWIRTRSGISNRHIVDEATASSDLAYEAAKLAVERANMKPEEIDVIIVATITPDMFMPSTACFVQNKLGAVNAAAFDISAACTGFIYGLDLAYSLIAAGQFNNALVIGAECMSKFLDYTDRRICVLMGDGAGAAVVKRVPEGRGFKSFYLRADGSGTEHLNIPAGGSRMPASHQTVDDKQHTMLMNGSEIFKFAVRVMEEAVMEALQRADVKPEDVTYIIPHQANIRIIESAQKRMTSIPKECWVSNLQEYGNTSSASIGLAMNEIYEQGKIKEGDIIVLVGFGGGLTWGATVLKW